MKRTVKVGCFLALIFLAGTVSTFAHHSISADFDVNQRVTLTGIVIQVEWTNPHAWFYMDVKDARGLIKKWAVQLGSPNLLVRLGWTRNTLKMGDQVVVDGTIAKDGSAKTNARRVRLLDGRTLFVWNPSNAG